MLSLRNWLWLLTLLLPAYAYAAGDTPLRFGSVAMDTPAVMQQRLLPLTDYLSEALGRPVVLRLSTSMSEAIAALAAARVDLAYLTPVAYVDAHRRGRAQLVARLVTQGRPTFKLMILVPERSTIRTVAQLAGKRFAFGDPAALLQRAVVVGAGMPLQRLGSYDFVNHYDNVVRGVLVGDFDAGIAIENTAYRWQRRGLRILYSSPALPPYNIAASARLDARTVSALRVALLRLDAHNPGQRAIVTALGEAYSGFAPATDSDYDVVRRLIRPFKR